METGSGRPIRIGTVICVVIALAFTLSSGALSNSPPQEPRPSGTAIPALSNSGTYCGGEATCGEPDTHTEPTSLASSVENGLSESNLPDFLLTAWPPDAQSTTGPVPPPGIERGIQGLEELAATVVLDVPIYMWHHGCGPTAAGMVFGYWDGNGFDNLVAGNADTQTAAVDAMIASTGNYNDYCLPLDYWPDPILDDLSELPVGDEHPNNCVADLMKTSQSYYSNYYGWSWFSHMDDSMQGYVDMVAPEYSAIAQNQGWGPFNWDTYRAEIDAGRPVVLLVDTDGDGNTDHFVTAIGYNDSGTMYGCHDTWQPPGVDWHTFAPMGSGQPWGIYGATLFQIETRQCSDPHEPNDSAGQATPISYGTTLTDPDICPEGDVDYYFFLASAGDTIIVDIDAENIGSSLDSHLYLYDTDGVSELTENDDHDGLDSRIEYTLPTDGTYYLKVQEYDHPNEGGPGYFYTISLWRWTHRIFLPLVMKNHSEAGGIVNGDFEAGATGWLEYSTHGFDLILHSSDLPEPPHSGEWAVWLGGDYDETSVIEQQVTVPASAPYLAYWHWIASQHACGYDVGGVIINGSDVVDAYSLCTSTNTGGWVKRVVDLTAYAGQSVYLAILAGTDESFYSSLFIDDVSVQAAPSSVQHGPIPSDLENAMLKSVEILRKGVSEPGTSAERLFHPE